MARDCQDAKDLICQIIAAAGGRLQGKLRLYKVFYYAHLYYWQRGQGVLTQHPIVRMPFGPGIHEGPYLLAALQKEGRIRMASQPVGPYREQVYELASGAEIEPPNPRAQAVKEAVEWVRDKSAVELSEETHVYSRSWREALDGQFLDIYADLLDDEEDAAMRQSLAEAEALLNDVF